MNVAELLAALAVSTIWMGAYSQLLGMPIAWLRLRKTPAWKNRPNELRRLELLAEFIVGPTTLTVIWGWLALLVAAIGDFGFSGGAFLVVIWGAPFLFVPWAVLRLDKDRFPRLVENARARHLRRLARRA